MSDLPGCLRGIASGGSGNEISTNHDTPNCAASTEYLNNFIEQDHRRIRPRMRPKLGFKRFDTAAVTISGIELAEKIQKNQFKIGKLAGRTKTPP